MKKRICILLLLLLLLCSCGKTGGLLSFDESDGVVTDAAALYPHVTGDTRTAYLLRRADDDRSFIATAPDPCAQYETVYTSAPGTIIYEISADRGVIAFYELKLYSDGGVSYTLKTVDTENGNRVSAAYSKTVSENTGMQTRFLYVLDGYVYYLTESLLLERDRVMKYSVSDGTLEEYLSFPLTENKVTSGSSCTFISGHGGYLTCGTLDGSRCVIRTYDTATGSLTAERTLPFSVAVVYNCEYDNMTGLYSLYYMDAQGDEHVGFTTSSDDAAITKCFTFDENSFVDREEVRLYGDAVVFTVQDQSVQDDPARAFTTYAIYGDGEEKKLSGTHKVFSCGGRYYALSFGKKTGYSRVYLDETVIIRGVS